MSSAPRARYLTLAVVGLLLAGGLLGRLTGNHPREFDTTSDGRTWAVSKGLTVWPEDSDYAFTVSDDPARKSAQPPLAGHPATWWGLVVVRQGSANPPEGIAYRRWGGVTLYGDPELLDR